MAENTEQYDWLVKIKENLEILFADRPDVFVAGDLLWYPVPDRRMAGPIAPDVLVAFGRPKGRRGSYKQWEENGVAPQVVFEIRSPSNSVKDIADKRDFYDLYGVEEYYLYDPADNTLRIWLRQGRRLAAMAHVGGWTSPRLGVRFALTPTSLELYDPAGRPFLTSVELARRAQHEAARAAQESARPARLRLQAPDFPSPAKPNTACRVARLRRKPRRCKSSASGATAEIRPAHLASSRMPSVPVRGRPKASAWRRARASSKITITSLAASASTRTAVSPGPSAATNGKSGAMGASRRSTQGSF